MPETTLMHKEAKSVPGFKACVSTVCDVRTAESPNNTFLRMHPCR